MIAEGFITLKDVFAPYAPYGIFTGQNIGADTQNLREKIDLINDTYAKCILNGKKENHQASFLFKREHPTGLTVTTRHALHQELLETYSGDSDTDDEGYDSDTAEQLYLSTFEFK